jgi:hypothetical protein
MHNTEKTDTLSADLSYLDQAVQRTGVNLEARVRALADTVRLSVDSYLGMRITLIAGDHALTVTAMERFTDPGDIAASARLQLAALTSAEPGSVIVFYASRAGAFVDLANDLGFALGVRPDGLTIDDHPAGPRVLSGVAGLSDMAQVNQAIGILIARGHTHQSARTELRRQTRLSEITLVPAAQRLILASQRPSRPAIVPG